MTDGQRFPGPAPVRLEGDGLVLREWSDADLPRMVELFDEPGFRRWTPLASPFDHAAAQAYLDRSRSRREEGTALQLAITTDGDEALGEVLMFIHPDVAELGWGLGAGYRGRRLASRAVRILLTWGATRWRLDRFRALIEPGNVASERVAAACGFVASSGTPILVESRGRTVGLTAWLLPEDRLPGRDPVANEASECR